MIAAIVLVTFYAVAALVAAAISFPWALITGNADIIYRMGSWVAFTGTRLAGIRTIVRGRELVPAGSCIYMCNHVSNLDPCVVVPSQPKRVSVLVKKSLMSVPVLGTALKLAECVPIDRDQRESAIASLREARRVLDAGLSIFIFAEGTRSRDGRLQPFKKGPFYLAYEAGVPVVPISVSGTETMMRKGSARVFPGAAHVTFHAPLAPADFADREALMAAVRISIASGLPAWMLEPQAS